AATSTNANEARSFVGHVRNEIDSTFNENEDVNGSNDQSHSDSKGKSKDEQKGDPRGRAIDIGGGSGDN
ncbi:MAG TPA: hypothetical protein VFP46_02740, partial [Candidatus Paceibacterota bacterium]|nr:hypothetical protein [Candidatus Paceibacterota bacterium]